MSDIAEIFFISNVEEEGEEDSPGTLDDDDSIFWSSVQDYPHHIVAVDSEEEGDDQRDFDIYHHRHRSREDYDVDALTPVFSHDFTVSNPPLGSRIFFEVDDSVSSFVDEELPTDINLDDRRFRHRLDDDGAGTDADGDPHELMGSGAGSDYLDMCAGDELGLGYGLDLEEQNFDVGVDCSVLGEERADVLDWSMDGFFVSRRTDRSNRTECDGGDERSRTVGYELGLESEGERVINLGEEISRTGGYESELEFEDGQPTILGSSIDGVQASDWSGVDLGRTYTVEPVPTGYVRREGNDELEWEEVDDRVEEREVLPTLAEPNENWTAREMADYESEGLEEVGDVGWDLFLLLNNINIDHEDNLYGEDEHEDFVQPLEYETLFGEFAEQDSLIHGSPPAAKSVVDKLPSVVVTEGDPTKREIVCAVCKDEIPSGVAVKQLPCKHHYHGDCILPWLEMRNTCPICRYELPTDDLDYERRKSRRTRTAGRSGEE